jgi:hypothetical protein
MNARCLAALVASVFAVGCVADDPPDLETTGDGDAIAHASLEAVMPSHLVIMLSMSWFGIPKSGDPLGPGPDPSWGNWRISGQCSPTGAPNQCVNGQRDIASRYRPLAGIYSSAGRDDESRARIRLALSTVRRSCANDVGARVDAFAIQLDGTKYTSLHTGSPAPSTETSLQALIHTYGEADAAGLTNAVLPADDAAWYWNNGHWVQLDCSANHATCFNAVQQDVVDMLTLAVDHPSSLRIATKPVLFFYFSTGLSPAEWTTIFNHARSVSIHGATHDFFALGSKQGGNPGPYYAAFDGLAPWISLDNWHATHGATVRAHAAAYAALQHAELYASVPAGKVVLGGIAPGFDDFTNGWSKCATRQLPPAGEAAPRDPGLLDGTLDYAKTKHMQGMILETWDDWTEGSFFEPSVADGTSKLVQLQTRLADVFGEAAVSPAALQHTWSSYGQPHGCAGERPSPHIDLCAASCGPVQIVEPTANENVGPYIHLRTTGPACIGATIAYVDGVQAHTAFSGNTIDAWLPVTMGAHVLNVNGWDANGTPYVSAHVPVTRTY